MYFLTADTKHSVHSPFVFDFVTNVMNSRKQKPSYHDFELVRSRLLKSDRKIKLLPLGAGKEKEVVELPLKEVAARSSKSARYAELLERICAYYRPQIAVEIGTSLGISAMYQASALQDGVLLTIEGNPESASVAKYNFEKLGFNNIQLIEGNFNDVLPQLMSELPRVDYVFFDGNHSYDATMKYFDWCLTKAHNNTIFIFDDISWSEDMRHAWNKIIAHHAVTVSIDIYAMGIVFFRKEQEKEHFVLRF